MSRTGVALRHDTQPEVAEALIWHALRSGTDRVSIRLNGFNPAALRVIVGRSAYGWEVSKTPNEWTLTRAAHEAEFTFYNLDNNRPQDQAAREIRALLSHRPGADGPGGLVLSETVGYRLPRVRGYRLVRDTSRPGRANVAAYVRRDLGRLNVIWHDQKETWGRTDHPGQHWARSILEIQAPKVGLQLLGGHQAPKGTDNTAAAQREGIRTLSRVMGGWHGSSLLLWDANRRPGEDGPGPSTLAERIGGHTVGEGIDNGVLRNAIAHGFRKVSTVFGVALRSDHGHAVRMSVRWRA